MARAMLGGKTGPNQTDWRKLGSKNHLIVDAQGIPLAVILTGTATTSCDSKLAGSAAVLCANRKSSRTTEATVPSHIGSACERERSTTPLLAKIGSPHGSGLGKTRWVIDMRSANDVYQLER